MKIHPDGSALRLKLRDPSTVVNAIPNVVQLDKHFVDVPFEHSSFLALRELGIEAPAPIVTQYDWPGRFTPFEAQLQTAAFLTLHNRAFVLSDIGTGKTLAVLWAYDFLRAFGFAEKMLVTAPLSTLNRAWADEIFHNFPHLDFTVLHGAKQKRRRLLEEDVHIYIINHDGVNVLQDDLATRHDITHVAIERQEVPEALLGTDRNPDTEPAHRCVGASEAGCTADHSAPVHQVPYHHHETGRALHVGATQKR